MAPLGMLAPDGSYVSKSKPVLVSTAVAGLRGAGSPVGLAAVLDEDPWNGELIRLRTAILAAPDHVAAGRAPQDWSSLNRRTKPPPATTSRRGRF